MAKKLHVQKRHIIEYADNAFFNYKVEDANRLISRYCPSFWGNCEDIPLFSDEVEVDANEFKNMIDEIKNMGAENYKTECREIAEVPYEELVAGFTYLYENRDKENECINLTWY